MSQIIFALAQATTITTTVPSQISGTTILGMNAGEFIFSVIGTVLGIIYVYQYGKGNQHLARANELTERGMGMATNQTVPRTAPKFGLPLVIFAMVASMWGSALYNGGYQHSGFISTVILLSAILILIGAVIISSRTKPPAENWAIAQPTVNPEIRITSPIGDQQFSSDPVPVRGTYMVRPKGRWMIWTRKNTGYWPQGDLVFAPNEKTWTATARINVNVPETTNILVAEVDSDIGCLINFYNHIGREINWKAIPIPQLPDGLKVADEVTVHKRVSASSATMQTISKSADDKEVALSKQDAYREFMSFGNTCDEIKAAKGGPGAPTLGLPDDLLEAVRCRHEAARQAAFLRSIMIDPDTGAEGLRIIEKVLEKLLFTDVPAARKAYKSVEQKLISARESLKGNIVPMYGNKTFPSAHEAAIRFAEDIARRCGVTSQENSLPEAARFQLMGARLALLPRVDGEAITGEMKREAIQASHSTTR